MVFFIQIESLAKSHILNPSLFNVQFSVPKHIHIFDHVLFPGGIYL